MKHHAVCHCDDCRRCSGALQTAWIAFDRDDLTVETGEPRVYRSSPGVERHFCGTCGTGLFYLNPETLPGIVDVQTATLDAPETFPPQAHIQMADRVPWEDGLEALPKFDRYPG